MELTTKAITLTATDYKEYDSLIRLYSLEYGKITVHAKGIRKANAKLRFCKEPFCFGQFEIVETHGRYVLKTCEQLESFFSVREDVVAFYAACSVAECLVVLEQDEQPNPQIFVDTLKSLKHLADGYNPFVVTLRFITGYLHNCGYGVDVSRCNVCGDKHAKRMYLDLMSGGAVCEKCHTTNSLAVSKSSVAVLQMLNGLPYEKLGNVAFPDASVKDCLQLLSAYISHFIGRIKSVGELVKFDY
ncbi:MAG: DNA repair protein RecO [Corallococcus sp.]|nr:DNA repair protein RecO [Corallococcus sp.]